MVDEAKNTVSDISMLTVLNDFLKKADRGTAGGLIEYYSRRVTAKELGAAQLWVAKHCKCPAAGELMAIETDDMIKGGGKAKAKLRPEVFVIPYSFRAQAP